MIGAGAEVGEGADLHGPVVVGEGSKVGAGARLRGCVLLPGTRVEAGAVAVGGVLGTDA
jgi:NDP-sugar pyrophosphorylase family protein